MVLVRAEAQGLQEAHKVLERMAARRLIAQQVDLAQQQVHRLRQVVQVRMVQVAVEGVAQLVIAKQLVLVVWVVQVLNGRQLDQAAVVAAAVDVRQRQLGLLAALAGLEVIMGEVVAQVVMLPQLLTVVTVGKE